MPQGFMISIDSRGFVFMDYKIDIGAWGGIFAVPNCLADEYIKIATADNLKVLLYCLRHAGQGLSAGEISRATGVAPDNVTSSFEFWRQRGLFGSLKHDNPVTPPGTAKTAALLERDYEFSPIEISDTIKNNKDVQYLFECAEKLYARPLKHHEQSTLTVIIEQVGMHPGVALMLLEYCFSIGKNRVDSIKKIARSWLDEGINSIESADSHIKLLKEYNTAENKLIRLLKIKDIPDSKKPLLRKWLYEFNHSIEKIYEVYQKTLERTGKLEYTYMDKVLSNLNESKTVTSAAEKPSYDLDELDKQIMEEYRNHGV
jgi:DnaD/phage-associated family protein